MLKRPCLCVWLACLIAPLAVGADQPAAVSEHANLIENGGFESWAELPPDMARRSDCQNVRLVPERLAPVGWMPIREPSVNREMTGTIARDEQFKHSGRYAVRLENRDMRDITCIQYSTESRARQPGDPHNIRPNRRYAVRWWVKGEQVDAHGTGPILMMTVMSVKDGKTYRTNGGEPSPLPKGTFDWQARQLVFVTDEYARWVTFSLQLRWTTGTIWYDDAELVDLGPVVHVDTY